MSAVYLIVLLVPILLLAWLATQDGDYEVRRSLPMHVEPQQVFDVVADFTGWPGWSPWLMHEPDARLEFSDDPAREGGWYRWDGKLIGAGRITHVELSSPSRIEDRIEFFRPFKSLARVWWEFESQAGRTDVSWCMQGRMPFLLRFLTPMTRGMIEKDFDLGLLLLRHRLDPSAEYPAICFDGESAFDETWVITRAYRGGIGGLGDAMRETFTRMGEHIRANGQGPRSAPFAAYRKVNVRKMFFELDMAMPVDPSLDAGGFVRKRLGGGRYYKVTQLGSYDFLKLTWYSAMAHLRMARIRVDRSRPSLEVYENDPTGVGHSNEIHTTLYIPVA